MRPFLADSVGRKRLVPEARCAIADASEQHSDGPGRVVHGIEHPARQDVKRTDRSVAGVLFSTGVMDKASEVVGVEGGG